MNKRWLVIVLFISLAFNLAIVAMFSYMSLCHKPPFCPPGMKPPFERDHHRMPPPDDNDKIRKLMGEDKEDMIKFRDDFSKKRDAFMKTLVKDTLNVKEAEAAMDASLIAHENLERHLGQSLIKVRQKLSSEEARTIFKDRLDRFNKRKDKFRHKFDNMHQRPNQEGEKQ